MIQAIVEYSDTLGIDFYFVTVSINKGIMELDSLNSYCKAFNKTIDLTQLSHLAVQKDDCPSLSFSCDNEEYRFVDYGNGIVHYIETRLPSVIYC